MDGVRASNYWWLNPRPGPADNDYALQVQELLRFVRVIFLPVTPSEVRHDYAVGRAYDRDTLSPLSDWIRMEYPGSEIFGGLAPFGGAKPEIAVRFEQLASEERPTFNYVPFVPGVYVDGRVNLTEVGHAAYTLIGEAMEGDFLKVSPTNGTVTDPNWFVSRELTSLNLRRQKVVSPSVVVQ